MVAVLDNGKKDFYVGIYPPTGDYELLDNQPAIGGVVLTKNTTKADLDLDKVFQYRGQVASYNKLPKSNRVIGDTYNVADTGENYAWNGSSWDLLTGTEAVYWRNGALESQGSTLTIDSDKNPISNLILGDITDVTATKDEVNELHQGTAVKNDFIKLHSVTADANELNILDGATLTTTELNYVDGVTSSIQTQLDNKVAKNNDISGGTATKITYDSKGLVTAGATLAASDIPDISSTYVTLNTTQRITSAKNILAEDVALDGVQANVFTALSPTATGPGVGSWVGRSMFGAKNLTFLMGTCHGMAGLGVHTWTDSSAGTGPGWGDCYIMPDGNTTTYIGGNSWTKDTGWFKVVNNGSNSGGKTQVNIGTINSANWKDVAYKSENISDFTNDAGYVTSAVVPNEAITGNTKCKITYDSKGLVTAGDDLSASDIPDISGTYQTVISDLETIRTGAGLGATSVQNTATGTDSLSAIGAQNSSFANTIAVGKMAAAGGGGISIGYSAQNSSGGGVTIGYSASGSTLGVTIGMNSKGYGSNVVAIGNAASIGSIGSNVDGAIMLGSGINNNAHTFRVGLGVFENGAYTTYEMLDSEGKVPGERMSKQSSSAPTTSTVGNIGQFYVDTTNEDGYMCVGIDNTDPENIIYTWKQITV